MSLSNQTELIPQKYITIATDISADEKYDVWTWACYIRWDGGVIKQAGEFKKTPRNTGEAETLALCNALVIGYAQIPSWEQSRIIIHNEIEEVLDHRVCKRKKAIEADKVRIKAILNVALPLLDRCQSYDRRKIKAHFKNWKESENPKKYYINRWCDQESRKLMKSIRKTKKKVLRES